MAPPRGRYWCWTLNNPTEAEKESLATAFRDQDDLTYICWAAEVGDSGTPHLQGYLELASKLRLGGVRKLKGLGRAHFELRKGTQEEAIEYTKKDVSDSNPFFEFGSRTTSSQGKRSDLIEVKESLDSGATISAIAESHFGTFLRYERGLRSYAQLRAPRTLRDVQVFVLWGSTGTGKTRFVFEREPELYISSDASLKWFDGYEGEPAVLLDDFQGCESGPFLLRLLDRYPVKVPVKGGFRQWVPERIYITANIPPPFGLFSVENALARRLTKVVIVNDPLDFEDRELIENLLN